MSVIQLFFLYEPMARTTSTTLAHYFNNTGALAGAGGRLLTVSMLVEVFYQAGDGTAAVADAVFLLG